MTRTEDVAAAVELGVNAIGVILHADSPRLITKRTAKDLRKHIPSGVLMVGVFVNASLETINELSSEIGLDLIQLHGNESNSFGKSLNKPFIKAIRVKQNESFEAELNSYPDACAILLEPYVDGKQGGSGRALDINLWPKHVKQKLILAGGLSASNLQITLYQINPFALDLNSGVEVAPGIKDVDLMKEAVSVINCG